MRIAQVSPLYEAVPPRFYGGTERVVYNLSEALTELGHDVTVFASGDSQVSCSLVGCSESALRLSQITDCIPDHLLMFEKIRQMSREFDIIHFHNEYLHFGYARTLSVPSVSTLHGRLDFPEYKKLFKEYSELPLVSISESQRRPLRQMNWAGNVSHGLKDDAISYHSKPGTYLAFLGRLSRDKGVEFAIRISQLTSIPLKIAAKIDPVDRDYYEKLRGYFSMPGIEYIGEIGDAEKSDFLGGALALLFPIQWPEPFGLVMIEAIAAGTPVIAFPNGSVREVVRNGVTGYIVDGIDEACTAVHAVKMGRISRRKCRGDFEKRFTASQMAKKYVEIYENVIESFSHGWGLRGAGVGKATSFEKLGESLGSLN